MVGWAMQACGNAKPPVPAHRVVNRQGLLTAKFHFGGNLMQQLLESEGVKVEDDQVQDFKTLFWEAETVLLYWLYQKSGIKLMRLASLIIWGAMICSLLLDWYNIYDSSALQLPIMGNKGFITTVCAAISCYLR